ncbi:MAG: GvpL/GvpF family gas vesicle protein [Methylococcales bacterium]
MTEKYFIYATIDNQSTIPNIAEFQAGGINSAPLEIVSYRDIAAVVSRVDVNALLGTSSTEQEETQQAYLLKYQQVNEFLLKKTGSSGMLPLKFGFTATSRQDVEKVLEQAYVQLRAYLDKLQGTIELIIQVTWDLPNILQGIIKDSPELASAADPVQTGRLLFEAAEIKKSSFVTAIHKQLVACSKEYSDAPLKTEAMIFNRSYLVEKDHEALFDEAVDLVATEFEDRLRFRYIGPLPAYSFVNIELNQGNFAMVDKSRQLLQLPEQASWETIKSTYRQLILALHPDKNPDNPQAAENTKAVVAAYDIVKAYCQSQPDFSEQDKSITFSFTQEAVEKTFITDDKGALLARTTTSKYSA